MQKLPLGPFDVSEPVGRGGMGSVWKGVHRESGVPVAVKILHRSTTKDGTPPQSFKNETRAVAALDHPGIVWVFDTGVVDTEAAVASNGGMQDGSPWLAMEYASGGTLTDFVPRTWEDVRALLLDLLSALGHAHSRGVVHRDLKPGNVLQCSVSDLRPGWKLTDFGIAAALEETVDRSIARGIVGTLAYMSPEQIKSDWRQFGPWTDLYALGCMIYRVVGHQRPFKEIRGPGLITAHLTQRPQRLIPRVPVPSLFAEWVDALLQKQPRDRFQSAAEAARMLLALGPPVKLPADLGPQPLGDNESPTVGAFDDSTEVSRIRSAMDPTAMLPQDWRTDEVPWPLPRLLGAGLGLAGIRSIPMVGRETERDALWSVLHDVARTGRARAVIVRGSVGVGKTRVARWIGETAHARGGIPWLISEARPDEAPQEALVRAFRRWFRTVRLEVEDRAQRLQDSLGLAPDDELVGLGSSLLATDGESGPLVEGEARLGVARALLEKIAGRRPAVLVLDDAHNSIDAVRFARHVLEAQSVRQSPLVLVLTVAEEASSDSQLTRELSDLRHRSDVRGVELAPLAAPTMSRLLQGLLPLERSLVSLLVERTAGNPLHAVELVKSWVSSDRLVLGDGGFELRGGTADPAAMPMTDLWAAQIGEVLDGLPPEAAVLLETAAALGSPVDEGEWQRVSDDPKARFAARGQVRFVRENAALRSELRVRMISAHLWEETEGGLAFVHEMLREAVLGGAREAGRLDSHHRACARMLLHRPDARIHAERIGRHLLLGKRGEQAVAHLVEGFRRRRRRSGEAAALPVLALVEEALIAGSVPADDVRWVELAVRRAETFVRLERADDAARWGQRGLDLAEAGAHRLLRSRALVALARALMLGREARVADDLLARAEGLVQESDDQRWLGEIQATRAQCARLLGDVQRSRGHSRLAARYLTAAGERVSAANAWAALAESAEFEGEQARAERAWERARVLFSRGGHVAREAECLAALGQLAHRRGDLEQARAMLALALERFRASGSIRALHAQLALARLHLARREWDDARRLASEVVVGAETARMGPLEVQIHAVLLTAATGLRDWSGFDVHLEQVRRGVQPPVDPDLLWCLDLAQARAGAAREERRSQAVATLLGQLRA
ncbi:MAG: protein kinase [Alphaproteobacteria bacterium]|nr:protein kinase [Alphaproteobacteria bacterium]